MASQIQNLIPQLSSSCQPPTKEYLQDLVDSEVSHLFVAESDNVVLGTLTLVFYKIPTGHKVWIEDVVVDGKSRGQKMGEKLTQFAINYVRELGISSINLTSSPERIAANKLYRKLGFEKRETNVYRITLNPN